MNRKKKSSSGTRTAAARKATPQRSGSSGDSGTACTQIQVASPSALALIAPSPRAGTASVRRVRFGYFKPEAREVHVVGSFNRWDPRATPLRRDPVGDWSIELELPTGEHRYRFFVDGEWRDDPSAQQTALNPFGGFDAVMVVL